ncbi:MAG TPA: hypothetical protein DEH78_23115, partial [Solibacterales bacterium]|nr:hypothetical protein [Bryobacterales bacterium]
MAWEYLDTGVADQETLAANRAAFRLYHLVPRICRDVSRIDPSTTLFGRRHQ